MGKSKNFNVGIDFGIFGCLNGSIEYYNKTSDALLLEKPLAPSTGFENAISNLGGMRNQGIEIDLHSTNINTKDFTWTTDLILLLTIINNILILKRRKWLAPNSDM